MSEEKKESLIIAAFVFFLCGCGFFIVSLSCMMFLPSDPQVRCETIEGARWSGKACYKNGIKLNFAED